MTTQLILLGTSSPRVTPDKVQTSFLLKVDSMLYMIDAGTGAHERLVQACAKYGDGLQSTDLSHIFLTHLHPDHTVGLPPMIISPYVIGRDDALNIYGPTGTRAMMDHILAAFKIGLDELQFHGPRDIGAVDLNITEIDEGIIYKDDRLELEAIRVVHGNLEAYAFKAVTADKTIFFSGDTCPVDILIEKAKGCDILIHEVYHGPGMAKVPGRWQEYFSRVHTSGFEVGQIANKVNPGLLILNHQMIYGGYTDADLIQEVRDGGYTGELVSGQDLQIFS
ncbi:MAG: ribonuclease BN (tRNA processing enzyme) [Cellvibrionaceae bacterium]|jgi:ribonuclease BN (tRNA processing enzyme)